MMKMLIKLFNSLMNPEFSSQGNEEVKRFFRAEYKQDAKGAYEHWISTNKTNYY